MKTNKSRKVRELAKELFQVRQDMKVLEFREREITDVLKLHMKEDEKVNIATADANYILLKVFSDRVDLIDSEIIFKELGKKKFLEVSKVMVEALRQKVGIEKFEKYVKGFQTVVQFRFFEQK